MWTETTGLSLLIHDVSLCTDRCGMHRTTSGDGLDVLGGLVDGDLAVFGLVDDIDVRQCVEQGSQSGADDRGVVDDDDSYRWPGRHRGLPVKGRLTSTRPQCGVGPAVIERLNRETNAVLADPKMKTRLAELGASVLSGSPAEFGKLIVDETAKWAKVVKLSGAKPD